MVLRSIPCSPECKIVGKILLDHPLSYALTATADVSVVYLQQFWRTVSETKINILQLFHTVINQTNVDYAPFLWWDFMNQFIKRIIADLMKKFLDIPQRIEKIIMQSKMIFPWYTPRAHRTPTLTTSTQGKKRKQNVRESSSPDKSLKISIKQQKVVRGNKDDDDLEDRLELECHKDKLEYVDDDDDKGAKKVDEEEGGEIGSLETRTKNKYNNLPGALRRMCRRQGYMIQNMERKCVTTKQFWKTHNQVNQVLQQSVSQLAEKAIEEMIENNLKPCIAATIIKDRDAFRSKMKRSLQDPANDPALWEVLKHKLKKSSTFNTSCREDEIHSHHDDHQEYDAPPEGEKRVKRHKALNIQSLQGVLRLSIQLKIP
nr:hypothetical protein [Tanacetum cinerariifolium]